jgi:hypothetical protein
VTTPVIAIALWFGCFAALIFVLPQAGQTVVRSV